MLTEVYFALAAGEVTEEELAAWIGRNKPEAGDVTAYAAMLAMPPRSGSAVIAERACLARHFGPGPRM